MDFDGLQSDVLRLIGGEALRVDPYKFGNDMASVASRDDTLTLLVHLGYLCYDLDAKRAHVPNEEVRDELRRAAEESRHPQLARVIRDSLQLVEDVLARDEEAAAAAIGRGYADVAYLPRKDSGRPAILVELKWDQPVSAVVDQVLDCDYPQILRDLGVPILVVAVTYDAKTKEHACRIFEA